MRAILCLVLFGAAVWAQGKEKPEFQLPPEVRNPKPETEESRQQDQLLATVGRLAGWPSERARSAAERLIVQKEKSLPVIREILVSQDRQHANLKPGAAFVLGRIGEKSDYLTLLLVAAEKKQQQHAYVFLEAAWRLDEEEAVAEAFRFFHLSETTLRRQAAKFVRDRVTRKNLDRISDLLDHRKADRAFTREIGLDLLDRLVQNGELTWEEAGPRFYQALGDESPQVASRAMRLLASRNDDENIRQLNELIVKEFSYWRQRSYAAMALGLLSSAFRVQPFTPETIEVLRGEKGLQHRKEMLAQAAAALALAQVALRSGDKDLVQLLDNQIPIVLIESVGAGNRHYRDFGSVMPLSYSMLRRITGQTFPDHAPEWARWWRDNGRRFRAKRELLQVSAQDIPETTIEIKPPLEKRGEPVRFTVVAKSRPTYLHGRAFALPESEMSALVEMLRAAGYFDQPEADETEVAPDAAFVVMSVGDLVRKIAFGTGEGRTAVRDRVCHYFDKLVQQYAWQLWWDIDKQPDWQIFFAENNRWFHQGRDEKERADRLRKMIAGSLNDIIALEDRLYAVRFVAALPGGGGALTGVEVAEFLRAVQTEREASDFLAETVNLLVPAAGEQAATGLVDALADKVGPQAQAVLVQLMQKLKPEAVATLAADPRWKVRRAALGALVDAPVEVSRPVYLASLDDKEALVRVVAAESLARLKDPAILPALAKLRQDTESQVRAAAAYAYGLLGGKEGLDGIRPLLFEDAIPDVKERAIQGLVDGKDPAASTILLEVFEREQKWRQVRAAAATGLVALETPELVERLVRRLEVTSASSSARVALVNVLARLRSDRPLEILRSVLEGDDEISADAAALGLARRWDVAAVGQLIDMVEKERNARAGVRQLQVLTSQGFETDSYERQAQNYKAWYKNHSTDHPRIWFRDALTERGYDTSSLRDWAEAAEGSRPELPDEAVPLLLRALRDKDWFIQHNASYVLAWRIGPGAPEVISYLSSPEDVEATIHAINDWWAAYRAKKTAEERG